MTRRFLETAKRTASILLLVAAFSSPAAGQIVLNTVAEVGDLVPGTEGLLFEAFGTHPVVQAEDPAPETNDDFK